MRPLLVLAAVLLAAPAARADGPTIDADRPGFLFAGSTVPQGYAEFEIGLPDYATTTGNDFTTQVAQVDGLLRVGVISGLELQVGEAWVHQVTSGIAVTQGGVVGTSQTVNGLGDLLVGAKIAPPAWPNGKLQATFVGQVTFPTGKAALSAGKVAFQVYGQLLWNITDTQNLGGMVGFVQSPASPNQEARSLVLATSYGFPIYATLSGYVELEWQQALTNASDVLLGGAGVAWLPLRFLQLDLYFDRGFTSASPDWLLGVGASVLFP